MPSTRRARRAAAIVPVLAAVALALVGCGSSKPDAYRGYTMSPRPSVASVSPLGDAAVGGAPTKFVAPAGGLLLVYFGYTSCPDICPTTLADVKKALGQLGGEASKVHVAMVTVDPKRDTGPVLTSYIQSFVPGGLALRTDDDSALHAVAEAFGASYSVEQAGDGTERVAHSTTLYAVDDRGQIVVGWPFGVPAADMAHDMRLFLSGKPVA